MLLNYLHKIKFFIVCISLLLFNCKKKTDETIFNADYIFPISSDTIDLTKFLGFTNFNIIEDNNCAILIDTLEIFNLEQQDFLPDLDFTIADTLEFPSLIFGFPFPPGLEIPYNFENNEDFIFEDVQLSEIDFKNLKISYTIESNLSGGVYFNLTIPSATNNNGQVFNEIINISNSNGQITTYSGEIYLADYTFDLSNNQTTFNNIRTSLRVGCSEDNTNSIILNSNSFLSMKLSLIDLNINTINGYFGSIIYSDTSSFILPIMEKFRSDNLTIENPEIELIINNGIGIDAELLLHQLSFLKNEISYDLEHPIINESVNISRAIELNENVEYSTQSIIVNNQNSNLENLIPIFPETIQFKYNLQTNPLGNPSTYNDFFNSKHTLETKLGLNIPFKFNLNNLTYKDTINISIPKETNANNAQVHLQIENEFPVECCISLNLINGDSIQITPKCISASNLNSFGNLISSQTNDILIKINKEQLDQIIHHQKVIITTTLNSPDPNINFPISKTQKLTYKMGLELNYNVNLK